MNSPKPLTLEDLNLDQLLIVQKALANGRTSWIPSALVTGLLMFGVAFQAIIGSMRTRFDLAWLGFSLALMVWNVWMVMTLRARRRREDAEAKEAIDLIEGLQRDAKEQGQV